MFYSAYVTNKVWFDLNPTFTRHGHSLFTIFLRNRDRQRVSDNHKDRERQVWTLGTASRYLRDRGSSWEKHDIKAASINDAYRFLCFLLGMLPSTELNF